MRLSDSSSLVEQTNNKIAVEQIVFFSSVKVLFDDVSIVERSLNNLLLTQIMNLSYFQNSLMM